MSFFINNAIAATSAASSAAPSAQADSTFSLVMIVAIFVLFYFMLIRPQNKRAKDHRDLINQLKNGDEVVTSGGFIGKVIRINEQFIKLSLADGFEVNLQRNAISSVLPKGTIKSL